MITNSQANNNLNYDFGKTNYTPPTTWYVGISSTPINKDGTGYTEPTGSEYKRIAVTNNKVNFTVASDGSLTITQDLIYDESVNAWGAMTHFFLASGLTGSNIKVYDKLFEERIIQSRSTLIFPAGELVLSN